MRKLTTLDDIHLAHSLGEILYAQDIENEVRQNGENSWSIWIHKEEQLEKANAILDTFHSDPAAPEFNRLKQRAWEKHKQLEKKSKRSRHKTVDVRTTWYSPPAKRGRLTIALIAISVAVALLTNLGDRHDIVRYLAIADFEIYAGKIRWMGFSDLESGQLWRLVTPIFIHFNFLHILFNMWWLWDLGNAIEYRKGSLYLGIQILVIAIISNLAQFIIEKSPYFGGMSGVVYGLLGYIWMLGKFDPRAGLYAPQQIVWLMLIWLVAGFTGLLGNIANMAHLGGLLVGVIWGFIASGELKRRLQR